jgi:hypothetical protein
MTFENEKKEQVTVGIAKNPMFFVKYKNMKEGTEVELDVEKSPEGRNYVTTHRKNLQEHLNVGMRQLLETAKLEAELKNLGV